MVDGLDEAFHLLALLVDLILKQRDHIVLVIYSLFRGPSLSRHPGFLILKHWGMPRLVII